MKAITTARTALNNFLTGTYAHTISAMYHAYNPNDYALLRTVLQHIVKNTDENPHIKATADSAYDASYLVGEYGQYKIPNLLESRSISTDALMSVTNDNVSDADFAATVRAWKIPNNRVVSTFIDEFKVVSDHIQAFTQAVNDNQDNVDRNTATVASLADNINSRVNDVIDQLTNFAGLHTEATKLRRDVIRVAKNNSLIPARATDVAPISAPAPSNDELPELVLNALGTVPTNLDDMIFVSKNKKKLPSDQLSWNEAVRALRDHVAEVPSLLAPVAATKKIADITDLNRAVTVIAKSAERLHELAEKVGGDYAERLTVIDNHLAALNKIIDYANK